MPENEIKLKITIDNKEAITSNNLTDKNLRALYQSFKYGQQEVNGLITSISRGFDNARVIIQGFKETLDVLTVAFGSHFTAYQDQEVALLKLSTALKQTGQYTQDNLQTLVESAAQLQRTTIYVD